MFRNITESFTFFQQLWLIFDKLKCLEIRMRITLAKINFTTFIESFYCFHSIIQCHAGTESHLICSIFSVEFDNKPFLCRCRNELLSFEQQNEFSKFEKNVKKFNLNYSLQKYSLLYLPSKNLSLSKKKQISFLDTWKCEWFMPNFVRKICDFFGIGFFIPVTSNAMVWLII